MKFIYLFILIIHIFAPVLRAHPPGGEPLERQIVAVTVTFSMERHGYRARMIFNPILGQLTFSAYFSFDSDIEINTYDVLLPNVKRVYKMVWTNNEEPNKFITFTGCIDKLTGIPNTISCPSKIVYYRYINHSDSYRKYAKYEGELDQGEFHGYGEFTQYLRWRRNGQLFIRKKAGEWIHGINNNYYKEDLEI